MDALLLVVAKAEKDGPTWLVPRLSAELLLADGGGWQHLLGQNLRKRKRGTVCPKLPLRQVWGKMEFCRRPGEDGNSEKVGYLKHFLEALGLPATDTGRRAETFNKQLDRAGLDVFEQLDMGEAGLDPWVGTKATFRFVYDLV